MSAPDRCTRCASSAPIRLRGEFDWGVPFALCGPCFTLFRSLDEIAAEDFSTALWDVAVLQHCDTLGSA